jgi:uncharacterized membrane protein YhiD involved in acid resistance
MEKGVSMPVPSGIGSLILGAVALVAVVYVYVLLQKLQKEVHSTKADLRTIAAHLEEEVHPAVDSLRQQQAELHSLVAATRQQQEFNFVPPPLCPQEEDIAHAMLQSMLGVSMRDSRDAEELVAEIESVESNEIGDPEDSEEEEEEEEECGEERT